MNAPVPPPAMNVVALDSVFDASRRRRPMVLPGTTVEGMFAAAYPDLPTARREMIQASVDGFVIPAEWWGSVKPKSGTAIVFHPVPGNDALRSVLTVVVAVAAVAAGQFYGPALAGSLLFGSGTATGVAASVASAAITGSVLIAGTLLINALVPVRADKKDQPSYAIQGTRNQFTPDGAIPFILGRVRYAPPYAARVFTTAMGDERYVTAAFLCGYGPLAMKDWRIGDTPLERFGGVQFETRPGLPSDARLTLYPRQVIEEPLSIELKTAVLPTGGPQIRTTAADVTSCEIDTSYPGGVFATDEDGQFVPFTVVINVRYRRSGTEPWTAAPPISVTSRQRKALTRTTPITFPERGRYEIELTRTTPDWDEVDQGKKDIKRSGRSAWSALRGFRPEYPINFDQPLALGAIRIQATGQLNGTVDALNAEFCTICPDWDAATKTWVVRETNNPASLFRYVLQGPAITYPLADDEIDLSGLAAWHEFCAAKGLTYNRVHDYEASVLDVLADVAAAGRASPHDTGTTWGVVIDRALSVVSAHIGPRNSWGFQGERPYTILPDAFRVSFLDETNSFEQAERIVPFPGFEGEPTITEKLELPGVTNPDMVWRETRRRQYEILRRIDTYTVNQDMEVLVSSRGDLVQLSHDVLDRVQVSARIRSVDGDQVTLDETVTIEPDTAYAIRFRRGDGSSLLRTVSASVGETSVVTLTGLGDKPEPGDLAFFGVAERESFPCTVKGIEALESFCARLTLVDHAPEIEALVDAEVPPPWTGRAGAPAQEIVGTPLVPIVTDVVSGRRAAGSATDTIPYPVVVLVRADPAGTVLLALFGVRHRKVGATAWSESAAPVAAAAVLLPGYTKGDAVELQPRAVSDRGTPSGWGESVTHTVAATDPAAPAVPVYTSATLAPTTGVVTHSFKQSPSASARSVQLLRALGFGKAIADATVVATLFEAPNQSDTTTDTIDVGLATYWLRALDEQDIASVAAGPRSVVRSMQANNLTTAPYDFTNAAWVKGAVTVAASGTAPDGQAAYLVSETAATAQHPISQTISITPGSKVRGAIGLKAAGRNLVNILLFDGSGSANFTRVFINFGTGALSAIANVGTGVTGITASITKVSADWFVVTLTATVNASSVRFQVQPLTDAGGATYAGDTAKGVGVWAGTLAVVP